MTKVAKVCEYTRMVNDKPLSVVGLGAIFLMMSMMSMMSVGNAKTPPVEVGSVNWTRGLEAAYAQSAKTQRPVFVLFQEVPGCAGCKQFGREVLKHPLLVEAIEDEFIPVLVYNNRREDAAILTSFNEPSWNYQVVRFLNAKGQDLIPRKDKVWTLGYLASRMVLALEKAKRPVPRYLQAIAQSSDTRHLKTAAFSQFCYWTGEFKLGKLEGVVSTEAGWLEGREVTRVVFDPNAISYKKLHEFAKQAKCADTAYAPTHAKLDAYRKAKASDQKKQLERWPVIKLVPNLTPMQLTKINALAPVNRQAALSWLSPRQRAAYSRLTSTR